MAEEKRVQQQPIGEERVVVPCSVFSRVVGYLSAVQGWNVGKKQEFKERKAFNADVVNGD